MILSDVSPYAVNLETRVQWIKGSEVQDFTEASTHWVFGKRYAGKSSLLEAIASNYIMYGATVYDSFCAADSESLAWLDSPFKKILFLCGDSVIIKSKYPYRQMKDFDMHEADNYQLVITTPAFFSNSSEMYHVLTDLVDMLRGRTVFNKNKINFLLVREARKLISSRVRAGKVRNRADAEEAALDLIQEAYHANLAVGVDSLRPRTLDINLREIANYVYIKKMGRLEIPNEFHWIMRYIHPTYFRNMPPSDYIFFTDSNRIAVKQFEEPYWHHIRGRDVLKRHNIVVERVSSDIQITHKDSRKKVTAETHTKIITLRNKGHSYEEIGSKLLQPITLERHKVKQEVQAHQDNRCGFC